MLKKLKLLVLLTMLLASSLLAQVTILSDEFDAGDGKWNTGWIDAANVTATFSIDTNSVLSGKNSYKAAITDGDAGDGQMWHIQRVAAAPLKAGYQYELSFMAVADKDDAAINVLFEIGGDPYTKRLDDTAMVNTTAQTFTYKVNASDNVADNFVKLMFGGAQNSGSTIWIDAITVTEIEDPTLITEWGLSAEYNTNWPILNNAATPRGNASMGGDIISGWKGLQGGFAEQSITSENALVVKGQIEFVGADAGDAYTVLRYALTYQDSNSTLVNALTDSATWSHKGNHFGYEFTPRTGNGTMANGGGGAGTVWTINNGNWASTWSNGGKPIIAVNQAPRNAEIIASKYNFAISVRSIDEITNEIKWYMIEQDNKYWFGGTVIDTSTTKKFNSIIFGVNEVEFTQFNVIGMRAELGSPITVPEAPWQSYYIDQWGLSAEYNTNWPILNDSTYLVGDASIGGDVISGWKGLQGGFGQDVKITTEKAIIVKGKIEFVGADAGDAYTVLRYALTYQDSNSTLQNALTDSATWSHKGNHFGYEFTPRTGNGTMANGGGGAGTVWTINNGNWASTWSNGGKPIIAVNQAPRNAEIKQGEYNFAISVRSVDDITNEIKWYMIAKDNSYWFGGTVIDTSTTKKFNSIIFGVNEVEFTQFNVKEMKVDLGSPITVPEAPWQSYYIDQWGLSAEYNTNWPILNDSTYLVGDASIGGDVISGWKGLQGGFGQDVSITTEKAIIVKGKIEFVGADAGDAYTVLRYALTYQDSNSTLQNALTDSATWSHKGNHFGYEFTPRTGNGTMANGGGGAGTVWTINNGNWASTWSNGGKPIIAVNQAPRNAEIKQGEYNFAISVRSVDDITNEIKWYMIAKDNSYWFGGTVIDTSTTKKFNSIIFGVNEVEFTQFNVKEMKVDLGSPITVPEAPFQAFYVDSWGFGDSRGGWDLTPGEVVGNVSISGASPNSDWSAVRGAFEPYAPKTDKALIVTGKMKFTNGGFEAANSLRFGLFYSTTAGNAVVDSVADSNLVWNGDQTHYSGYLMVPPSGTNAAPNWVGSGMAGTWGGVSDGPFYSTEGAAGYVLGDQMTIPANTVGSAGTYEFKISVSKSGDNAAEVRFTLSGNNGYYWEGSATDNLMSTDKFNSIGFALNTNTTTGLDIMDVYVNYGDPIVLDVENPDGTSVIPVSYSLNQNYPNPFNPATTIEFALPKDSDVKLAVYDILGREITQLINSDLKAGYHRVNFDASNLASGIYFYSIKAGDFTSVKKLVLMK